MGATARTVPAKAAKPTPKAAPPASPHEDGTMNPWSLNPQTGSSKVPVAKEDTTSKTAAAKPSLIKTKKKRRRLLGKGGVKNVEDTKSHMKHKTKVKKLKL